MKNPWMSMWLSAANQAAGTARSFWMAEAGRQQAALVRAMTTPPKPAAAKARTARKRAPAKKRG